MEKQRKKPRTINGNYGQNWELYNLAKTNEKRLFPDLAHALCQRIPDSLVPQPGPGRHGLSYSERAYSVISKVYECGSARRAIADLHGSLRRGHISRVPHFNSVLKYFHDPYMTPILEQMVVRSSWPLREVEKGIAIDATGFASRQYEQWRRINHHKIENRRIWRKLHIACGVETHIVTCAIPSGPRDNDFKYFQRLLATTDRSGFTILQVYADRMYHGGENYLAVFRLKADPLIPFKKNSVRAGKSQQVQELFDLFHDRPEEFNEGYHERSNVETVFSMVKAKFSPRLRAEGEQAQDNEMLAKVVCHNLGVLVQAMYERSLNPDFSDPPAQIESESSSDTVAA